MKLYSYVVDHDTGYAPNPFDGFCTLCRCKYSKTGRRRNIVELAKVGDWIVGTGGLNKRSSGHGTIVYAMEVTQKISLADYCQCPDFRNRRDAAEQVPLNEPWREVLISDLYFYFGRKAVPIPPRFLQIQLCRRGFKWRFPETLVQEFVVWIKEHKRGVSGLPCVWSQDGGGQVKTYPRIPTKKQIGAKGEPCPKSI